MKEFPILFLMILNYVLRVHSYLIINKRNNVTDVYKMQIVKEDIILFLLKKGTGGKITNL